LIDTPNISNYVANCNLTPNSPVLTISENTHYGKLTVGQNIIVDVSSHDIYLVVDGLLYAPNAAATVSSPGYDTSGNIIP